MALINGTQLLRNNIKVLRGLFRQFETVDSLAPEMKEGVVNELLMMLEIHCSLEEEFLCPALQNSSVETDRDLAESARIQHQEIQRLINAVRRRDLRDEHFNIGVENLITTAEEHFGTSEHEIYQAAEKLCGSCLDEMSGPMQARYDEYIQLPQYKDARPQKRKRAS